MLPAGQRSKLCGNVECPYRGKPLIQVLQVNSCAGDFQPIDLKDVFQVLEASVEGREYSWSTKDRKDIVKGYASLKVIDDVL